MAETGLKFTSDGSSNYIKTLNKILTVSERLDKAILKIVKDTRKWKAIQFELNATITSSTRRMNTLIDRVGELDVAFREVISRIPQLQTELKRGFEGGNLNKFMQNKGIELGEAFMRGIETELGIASPSRKMKYVAGEINRGFELGLKAGNWAASGAKVAGQFVTGFVRNVSTGIRNGMGAVVRIVQTGVQNIERELDKAGRSLRDRGGSLVSAGLGGIAAGGIIAGATLGVAGIQVQQAIQFEQIMTNTGAIMGQNREEMRGLNEELLRIGGSSVAGVDATASAFYDIVSGVQDASLHMGILNAAIATSEAGQSDLTATTSGLVAMMNSYSASGVGAGLASDVFSRTVQMGVGSMNQFVAAMSPIAGLASSVGVSIDELGAGMAFLTAKGATTSAAATRLQSAMVSLLKPNTQMAAALQAAGYESGQAAIETLGLAGALDVVNDALDGDSAAFAAALGSTEALQGAVGLLSEDYAEFYDTYNEGLEGATERSRIIQLEGTYAIFAQIQSAVGALSVEIGNELLPMVRLLATGFLNVVNSVLEFVRENRAMVGTLVRIATIMGVLLGGIVAVGGAIAVIGGIFAIAGGFVLTFTASLIGLAVASLGFANDILAVAAVVGSFDSAMARMGNQLNRVLGIINNVRAGLRAVTASDVGVSAQTDPKSMERENALLREREDLMRQIAGVSDEINESQAHQVEAGDTLWDLAQRYGTTVEAIREANELDGSMISIGQELTIPVGLDTSAVSEDLAKMEADLADIDSQLETLGGETPIGLETMNQDMQALVNSADLVVDGFMSMFGGDVTGGLEEVRTGFVGIGDAVGNLWGRFQGGFETSAMMEDSPLSQITGDIDFAPQTRGENPIISWMNTVISEASDMDFTTLSQTIADNLDVVVSGALTIVGMMIGFPIGSTIGFARMLIWAVESDFMDFGTMLAETGVLDNIESGFNTFKTAIEDIVSSVFGGGETIDPLIENMGFTVSATPFESMMSSLQPLLNMLSGLGATAIQNLPIIASGLVDFFTELISGIDMKIMGALFTDISELIGGIVGIATIVTSGLIGGLSAAGGDIGAFIADIVNAGAALLTGDYAGAFTSLVGALGSFISAIGNFSVGAADGVILAINNLFGIELPSVDEGLVAYAGAFENAWFALQIVVDNIKRGLSKFSLGIRTDILELLAGLRDDIYEGSLQTIDIAPNINTELAAAQSEETALATQDAIAQSINEQIRETGGIDINVPIEINGEITTLGLAMEGVETEDFGTANIAAITNALGFAYESGDVDTVRALLPIALEVGIDVEGAGGDTTEMRDAVWFDLAAAFETGDVTAAEELIPIAIGLGLDVQYLAMLYEGEEGFEAIKQGFIDSMAESLGEGDSETLELQIPIALAMGISDDEVLETANEAGYEVGDSITLGLLASLQIESPSQVGIDAGMMIMTGISVGMNSMLFQVTSVIDLIVVYIFSMVKDMAIANAQMLVLADKMGKGFEEIGDSAQTLWGYLNSIKKLMVEFGMTPEQANNNANAAAQVPQGRAKGGDISRGTIYETNEGGISEMAVIGGRTYLLAGADGYVTPMQPISDVMGAGAIGAGAGANTSNVVNYNGDFVMQIPPEADDPEAFQEWFVAAMDAYNSQTTISDRFRDRI